MTVNFIFVMLILDTLECIYSIHKFVLQLNRYIVSKESLQLKRRTEEKQSIS